MSTNMFDLLSEDPVVHSKPAAAETGAASKPAQKALVGGAKKGDAPKRDGAASSSQSVTKGSLPGDNRKEVGKGPRHKHQPRTDQGGKIRGREHDRHSGTGRPAGENKRGGAGRANWGSVKNAQEDEEAATAIVVGEATETPVEGAVPETVAVEAVATEPKEEEPKTEGLAAFRAAQKKQQADFESKLGLAPQAEVRVVSASWYKAPEKPAAPKATSSAAASKEPKQVKKVVPVSSIIGEKRVFSDDRRGPREHRGERSEGGDRPFRGGDRDRSHNNNRQGGNSSSSSSGSTTHTNNRHGDKHQGQGGKGGNKNRKVFDATANTDSLPALGQ